MSDTPPPELVDRLHENLHDTLTTRLRAYYTSAETRAEAADHIEELTAECRDLTTRAEAAEEAYSEARAEGFRLTSLDLNAALAERDTLAEMVRLFDPSIEFTTEVPAPGWWMSTKAGRVEVARVITPDQAERFASVLDRISEEAEADD